jgi:RNA polymerase sigma-70 factor (ECF subfamily)
MRVIVSDRVASARASAGREFNIQRMSETHDSDRELIERLLRGDEEAFEQLVAAYHGRLLRLARTFHSDRGASEEIVQDTWMAVLQGLRQFEGRSSLSTWLFRILANRAKTRAVRDRRMVPFSDLEPAGSGTEPAVDPSRFTSGGGWADPPRPWDAETPEKLLLRSETAEVIKVAIEGLPPGQRAVVTLRDVEGLSSDEVCNILSLTETNQRVLLHRARSRLRSALERYLKGK